jgi:ribosomal protein L40E
MSAADREEAPPKGKAKEPAGSKGASKAAESGPSRATSGNPPRAKDAPKTARAREASAPREARGGQASAARAKAAVDSADDVDEGPFADEERVAEVAAAPVPAAGEEPENKWIALASRNAWIAVPLLLPVAIVVGLIQGAQAVLLLLIGAALVGVITLFWNSLRTLLGETPLSGADAYAIAAPRAEEEQKQAVLRALKDLEFERSVGKISDEDYAVLVTKYRAEAKRLLRVIEEEARPRRERVEWLVKERLIAAGLDPVQYTYRSGPDTTEAEAKPFVDDEKKGKKKSKAKGEGKPAIQPSREAESEPAGESEAKKASVEVTLKSEPPSMTTKESPAYVPPTKTCSECGVKNDPDANFCKKCGSKRFEKAAGKVDVQAGGEKASPGEASSDEDAENEAAEDEADAPSEEEART